MFCGSILTSSASGSWSRRPIEIVLAQRGVELGQLLAADLAGRVDAGAGLVDDHVGELGELAHRPGAAGAATGGGGGAGGCLGRGSRRARTRDFPGRLPLTRRPARRGGAAAGRGRRRRSYCRRPGSLGVPLARPTSDSGCDSAGGLRGGVMVAGRGRLGRPARRARSPPVVGDRLGRDGLGRGSGSDAAMRPERRSASRLRLPVVRRRGNGRRSRPISLADGRRPAASPTSLAPASRSDRPPA